MLVSSNYYFFSSLDLPVAYPKDKVLLKWDPALPVVEVNKDIELPELALVGTAINDCSVEYGADGNGTSSVLLQSHLPPLQRP